MSTNRLQDVNSIEEFRLKVLGLYELDDKNNPILHGLKLRRLNELGLEENSVIELARGLEDFVDYVLQHGTDDQRFAIGWEEPYGGFHGIPPAGSVKTLVYTCPDSSLLLCLLNESERLDEAKIKPYINGGQLKKASKEDLSDLGMVPYGCHGFPSSVYRRWEIVMDDSTQVYRHPIYLNRTSRKVGVLFVSEHNYTEIMNTKFPDKITRNKISRKTV